MAGKTMKKIAIAGASLRRFMRPRARADDADTAKQIVSNTGRTRYRYHPAKTLRNIMTKQRTDTRKESTPDAMAAPKSSPCK